jgi:hypothetical protein
MQFEIGGFSVPKPAQAADDSTRGSPKDQGLPVVKPGSQTISLKVPVPTKVDIPPAFSHRGRVDMEMYF